VQSWAEPLPWQINVWRQLADARRCARMPHALLISGARGVGKRHLGLALAARLLCGDTPQTEFACGSCKSCRLLRSGSHPDYLRTAVDEGRTAILVDQIRQLCGFLNLTSSLGGSQVAMVETAHRMNESAANSLLKTLEEPPASSYLILVTESPARLPATVRSRCHLIRLPGADLASAVAWMTDSVPAEQARIALALCQGAPVRAMQLLEGGYLERRQSRFAEFVDLIRARADPLQVATRWADADVAEALAMAGGWLEDLLRLQASGDSGVLRNADLAQDLQALQTSLGSAALFAILDSVREAQQLCETSVVPQLLLERMLVHWQRCVSGEVEV